MAINFRPHEVPVHNDHLNQARTNTKSDTSVTINLQKPSSKKNYGMTIVWAIWALLLWIGLRPNPNEQALQQVLTSSEDVSFQTATVEPWINTQEHIKPSEPAQPVKQPLQQVLSQLNKISWCIDEPSFPYVLCNPHFTNEKATPYFYDAGCEPAIPCSYRCLSGWYHDGMSCRQ
jgi:hypothetical protein